MKKGINGLLCWVLVLALLAACGPAPEEDPEAVVRAFYEAANVEDLEAFMALVAEEAEIEWGRECLVTGKEDVRRHAEHLFQELDFTFELSDVQVEGNRITFNHELLLDGTETVIERCADEVLVEGGKIRSALLVECVAP